MSKNLFTIRKTCRLVIVDEDCKRGGVGAETAGIIAEEAFDLLDAPVKRVARHDAPIPCSPPLGKYVVPITAIKIEPKNDGKERP